MFKGMAAYKLCYALMIFEGTTTWNEEEGDDGL
jgi:hypothetical protein